MDLSIGDVARLAGLQAEGVRRVLVIGGGTMGLQIALQAATHGYDAVVYDVSEDARNAAPQRLRSYGGGPVRAGLIDAAELERALARITVTGDPVSAAADVDLVSESLPEDPKLKGSVLAQFNRLCPLRTIFATNASTLLPSTFAGATGRPDRFAALHFHTPVWMSNVADVMPQAKTSPATVDVLIAFARSIGQIPIVMRKESSGYVFNAMYTAINHAAITLAANGVTTVEDVDRSWMAIFKMPIGPFGLLDAVGLDTVWHITEYWARQTRDYQTKKNAAYIKTYVDRGCLGVKSGEGFYHYPNPAFAAPEFVEGA